MITTEDIQNRIDNIQMEISILKESHDQMVAERNRTEQAFQQKALENQQRFQQLSGALNQLNDLLNQPNGQRTLIETIQ